MYIMLEVKGVQIMFVLKGFEGNEQSNDTIDEKNPIILAHKLKNENTSTYGNMIISFGKFNCFLKKNHVN